MPKIEVRPGELGGVADHIDAALAVGDEVRNAHSSLRGSAAAAGRGDVSGAIGSFLDAWSYGLGHINEDAHHLAHLLRLSASVYDDTESAIVQAARP